MPATSPHGCGTSSLTHFPCRQCHLDVQSNALAARKMLQFHLHSSSHPHHEFGRHHHLDFQFQDDGGRILQFHLGLCTLRAVWLTQRASASARPPHTALTPSGGWGGPPTASTTPLSK